MLSRPFPSPSILALLLAAIIGYLFGKHTPPASSITIIEPSDTASNPRHAIVDELTAAETRAVAAYVVANIPGVKTTMYPDGGSEGDYMSGTSAVELLLPDKATALAYIDGKTDTRPARYARVSVVRGSKVDVMEYKVGPLHGCDVNDCDSSYVEPGSPIVPLVADGTIPFEKRPVDMADATPLALASSVFDPLKGLLLESFGPIFSDMFYPNCGKECFSGEDGDVFPFAFNDILSSTKQRVSKIQFFWFNERTNFQAMWLHNLPFSFRVAQVGTSQANWKIFDVYYCGSGPYESAEALLKANPPKCTYKPDPKVEGKKGSWDIPGPDSAHKLRPALPTPPPRQASYKLSGAKGGNGRLVEWQGWSFFATLRPSTGLAAMDIRFKGNRVAYELALTEAAAHYSGTGADQVFYLDSAYSMSQLGGDLKPGIDCPSHATFLNAPIWLWEHEPGGAIDMDSDVGRARSYKAFCIFEEDAASSHWRHLQLIDKKIGGVPSSTLVVRAVTAVGNYDYVTEYRFGLDGSIKVKFDFAGYMETRWFSQTTTPWERSLGEIVRDNLAAPLHSHFGCFKVDLDGSAGEKLEATTITAGMKADVPELRGFATKYIVREHPEAEVAYRPSEIGGKTFAIVDGAKMPTEGDATPSGRPGYMIKLGPTVGQALPDDHPFVLASAFSKYALAVTKRKESERRATSVYDLFGPAEPYVSLDTFLDGESIDGEDLVAWVNLGKEHLPRTEDVPLISNFGTYFDLLPRNVHKVNAAMDVFVE